MVRAILTTTGDQKPEESWAMFQWLPRYQYDRHIKDARYRIFKVGRLCTTATTTTITTTITTFTITTITITRYYYNHYY